MQEISKEMRDDFEIFKKVMPEMREEIIKFIRRVAQSVETKVEQRLGKDSPKKEEMASKLLFSCAAHLQFPFLLSVRAEDREDWNKKVSEYALDIAHMYENGEVKG